MISLAFISRQHAGLGTELAVLWGNPGTRRKRIRATVARFPYLAGERNDVAACARHWRGLSRSVAFLVCG